MEEESKLAEAGVGATKEAGGDAMARDELVRSGESGTVTGAGRVCLFDNGGGVACMETDGMGSGRAFVGVL
jgi:hypothetical protein